MPRVKCTGCGQEIDPEVCQCGQSINHGYDNHPIVPMGCDCWRRSWEESDEPIETTT